MKPPPYRLAPPYGTRPIVIGLAALAVAGAAVVGWLMWEQASPAAPPGGPAAAGVGAQASPSVVATASPGAGVAPSAERDPALVEVCGLGWVEVAADATSLDPAVLVQVPGIDASARAIVTALHDSSDRFARAVGSMIEANDDPGGATDPVLLEQLAGQAVATDDPRVYALAWRSCMRARAQGSCGLLSTAQWARLDPANALPWLFALDAAAANGDRPQIDEALHRIGSAARFDDRFHAAAAPIVERAGASDPDLMAAQMLATRAVGIAAALPLPLRPLTRVCSGPSLLDANRRQACDAAAATLAERSDSALVAAVGAGVGRRLGWPAERIVAIRAVGVALSELWASDPGADPRLGISYGCDGVRATLARLGRLARIGEPQAARDWMAASGKPYEAYLAVARDEEARRSAAGADSSGRPPAPAPRGESASE